MNRGRTVVFLAACLASGCSTGHAPNRAVTPATINRQAAEVEASGATASTTPSTTSPWAELGEVAFLDQRAGWAPVAHSCGGQTCISVYATSDGGETWRTRTVTPMTLVDGNRTVIRSSPMVRTASPKIGWVVADDGTLYASTDGAATWHQESTAGTVIALEAHGPDVWRLEKSCRQDGQDCHVTLMTSDDYGQNWEEAHPPIGATGASLVWPARQVAYILSDRGNYTTDSGRPDPILARTTDAGVSWTTLRPPCFGTHDDAGYEGHGAAGWDLAASVPQDLWLVCRDGAASGSMQRKHLFRSSDGGETWSPDLVLNGPAGGYTVAASPTRACRGADQGAITCTRDGGQTWFTPRADGSKNPSSDQLVSVFQFVDERHGWGFGRDQTTGQFTALWHTGDGGESWSRQHVPIPAESARP